MVSITSDLAFPDFPTIRANHASELTESEFLSMVVYMTQCENYFNIVARREAALAGAE